jgi:hypothetical protein
VDDFLVWKWFLRTSIPDIRFTLQSYSLESIRDVLGLVTPLMHGAKIDLSLILQTCERYARIWHSTILPSEHINKSFLSFSDLLPCVLKEQAGHTAREAFLSAFSEACMFSVNVASSSGGTGASELVARERFTADKMDFRQFATALIWVSNLKLIVRSCVF